MPEYEFTLRLGGLTEVTDEAADALFLAGCDDSLFYSRSGVAYLDFCRAAPTRAEAVASAVRDVRAAGLAAELREPAGEAA